MKNLSLILLLALILCFMVGCQDKETMVELEEFKAQAAVEEQNITLIKRFYEAWNSGNDEAIMEIVSPDYVWHLGSGQDFSLEQLIEIHQKQKVWFPDIIFSVEDLIAKGDKVVARYISKGTHKGDIEGLPATGKNFESTGIDIWRVENGKIVESREVYDELQMMMQLGMELKPKEKEK